MLFVSSNSNLEHVFFFQLSYQLNDLAQLGKGFSHIFVNQVILIEALQ